MGKIKPPDHPNRAEELRLGRNFVRKGDLIKVRLPGNTNRMWARFQYVDEDAGGQYACVHELEKGESGALVYARIRCVKPDAIDRVATTHDPIKQAKAKAAAKRGDKNA